MRIPTARLSVCLMAAGLLMSCASSQGPKLSAADKSFLGGISSYDKDHDNVVTCQEWQAAAASLFARADKSGAGALNEQFLAEHIG